MKMQLLGSDFSPFTRKVRVVLAEKKIECRYEREDVFKADSRINSVNPLGKIPALIMEDGGALFDSRVIVEYLDQLTPVHRLIPQSGRARVEVKCWEALADGVLDAAVLLRFEQTQRKPEERSPTWIARQTEKVNLGVAAISKGLGTQDWCNGAKYSLADISVGCALGYLSFRFPEINWREAYPNLVKLSDKLEKRPSFEASKPT